MWNTVYCSMLFDAANAVVFFPGKLWATSHGKCGKLRVGSFSLVTGSAQLGVCWFVRQDLPKGPAVLLRNNQVVSPRKSLGRSQQDVAWIFSHLFPIFFPSAQAPMIDLQKLHLNSCSNQWQCWLCCDCAVTVSVSRSDVGLPWFQHRVAFRMATGAASYLENFASHAEASGHSCGSCGSWRCGHETAQERTGVY